MSTTSTDKLVVCYVHHDAASRPRRRACLARLRDARVHLAAASVDCTLTWFRDARGIRSMWDVGEPIWCDGADADSEQLAAQMAAMEPLSCPPPEACARGG